MGEEKNTNELKQNVYSLSGMFDRWFLDYASYVILERAVPSVYDGFKPVQRRILHAMKEIDDGRYNKVANIIGNTMQFHPHGDQSIADALVQLGQKNLLIDMQGNWGNVYTGDRAAASRYIEARLSKFALDVVYSPKITEWKMSYDGRKREPVNLPVKFPLLLAQGAEGIAVSMSTKILPHNFIELIDASIAYLRGQEFELYPDFFTGGLADISKYNDGKTGSKVKVRAKISQIDKKVLQITELPFGIDTGKLIDDIVKSNEKGKIKIKKIEDNTASEVEILITLANNVSPDKTIDALYAFTKCEMSISPSCGVIKDDKPIFIGVSDILRFNTDNTVKLLRMELEIQLDELKERLLFSSLEKIFIKNRIYILIEECETWDSVLKTIDKGLEPYKKQFYREIIVDDIIRLTEIKIKRISKFDAFKADDIILSLQDDIEQVKNDLNNIINYSIAFYKRIKKKHGAGKERKTELRSFESIRAETVAVANVKLFVNREEGFVGTSLKKDEFVCDCSDIDDIIVILENGDFQVFKATDKTFIGKNILHVGVFRKNDKRTIYNLIYQDGKKGNNYIKRFAIGGVTRDKEYALTKGTVDSRILYLTVNPNGEAEMIKVFLRPKPKLKKTSFEYNFADLAIKGRASIGNILSKNAIRKVVVKEVGISTLGAINIWYDDSVRRLNKDNRGNLIGEFVADDKIIELNKNAWLKFHGYSINTHFEDDMIDIRKYDKNAILSLIYKEGDSGKIYIKRFILEYSDKKMELIGDHPKSKLLYFTFDHFPVIKVLYNLPENSKANTDELIELAEFIGVKGYKAKGKRISSYEIKSINFLEPLPYTPPVIEQEIELEAEEIVEEKNELEEKKEEKKNKVEKPEKKEEGKEIKEEEKEVKAEKRKKEKPTKDKKDSNNDQSDSNNDEEDEEDDSIQLSLF